MPDDVNFRDWASEAEFAALFHSFEPRLHICDGSAHSDFAPFLVPPEALERGPYLMRTDGYFQLDCPDWNLPIELMAAVIQRLQKQRMPTALCFIYDEFWLLFAKLHHLLAALIGENYKLLPDFWAWCVGGDEGDEAGWIPHRDKNSGALNPDGSPRSLTVWISLTDATPLNGCMYIVPADKDRAYPYGKGPDFDLADVRALPAPAGSVFFWNQAVFHWGGRRAARHNAPARISVAFEFQSGDIPPFNNPLLDPLKLFGLPFRMQLVAKQVLQYQHMYPLSDEARALVERILGPDAVASPRRL